VTDGNSLVQGFGKVVSRPELVNERLSEEHEILAFNPSVDLITEDVLEVIPNRPCIVINLFDEAPGV